jgi:hypothetical protein
MGELHCVEEKVPDQRTMGDRETVKRSKKPSEPLKQRRSPG